MAGAPTTFDQVFFEGENLGLLVEGLTSGKIIGTDTAHLDPDLRYGALARQSGWRPAFGQSSSAQSHLNSNDVGKDDLFLFFGWFKEASKERRQFSPGAANLHIIFGWLQVGEVLTIGSEPNRIRDSHPWLKDHPHLHAPEINIPKNVIYVASENLCIPGLPALHSIPGGGVFNQLAIHRTLTKPDQKNRSLWQLSSFFHPSYPGRKFSYHSNPDRWGALMMAIKLLICKRLGEGKSS